jgi:HAD superfamily hydrolase (TIGR01458 family)
MKDNVKKEFSHVEVTTEVLPGIRAVFIGDMVEKWNITQLNLALKMLLNAPDSLLVALGMTRYYMSPDGYRLDVGSIVKALEYATGKEPVVLGKPSRDFFHTALEILNVKAENTIMIGDDIASDIGGSQNAGLKGILVRTGKFKESDLVSGIEPHAVIDSIADFPVWFEKYNFL